MPKMKPFAPKTGPEKKLASPEHAEPLLLAYQKNPFGAVLRVEGLLGIRFKCAHDEYGTPQTDPEQLKSTADMLEETYKQFANTVGELYVEAEDLAIDSARLIFTLPYTIAGHRKKGVVGTFNYFPATDTLGGQEIVTLHREKLGQVRGQAEHDFFKATGASDPTWVHGAGTRSYIRNQGYVSGD